MTNTQGINTVQPLPLHPCRHPGLITHTHTVGSCLLLGLVPPTKCQWNYYYKLKYYSLCWKAYRKSSHCDCKHMARARAELTTLHYSQVRLIQVEERPKKVICEITITLRQPSLSKSCTLEADLFHHALKIIKMPKESSRQGELQVHYHRERCHSIKASSSQRCGGFNLKSLYFHM